MNERNRAVKLLEERVAEAFLACFIPFGRGGGLEFGFGMKPDLTHYRRERRRAAMRLRACSQLVNSTVPSRTC